MDKERITIMLSTETVKKVRRLQAKRLTAGNQHVSFSIVIEDLVEKGLSY
jgi:hypothetical protein